MCHRAVVSRDTISAKVGDLSTKSFQQWANSAICRKFYQFHLSVVRMSKTSFALFNASIARPVLGSLTKF